MQKNYKLILFVHLIQQNTINLLPDFRLRVNNYHSCVVNFSTETTTATRCYVPKSSGHFSSLIYYTSPKFQSK